MKTYNIIWIYMQADEREREVGGGGGGEERRKEGRWEEGKMKKERN